MSEAKRSAEVDVIFFGLKMQRMRLKYGNVCIFMRGLKNKDNNNLEKFFIFQQVAALNPIPPL
jgi:hypothetical protein